MTRPRTYFCSKKIVSALILPPISLILLGFIGLWLTKKHPKAGKTLTALAFTILLILSLPITGKPILVTGGAPFGGRPEADAMAEALKQDFHAKTIWVEDRSNDTAENAIYSAKILKQRGITKIALVSQAWHLPRAIKLFEQQDLAITPAPTGYVTEEGEAIAQCLPKASALNNSSMALKEYLGTLTGK